jgi:type I restriction enzyme M protein
MTYWAETMQDDFYIIAAGGWQEASKLRLLAGNGSKEQADLTVGKLKYKADLIPPQLLVDRYFVAEKRAMDDLESERDAAGQRLQELQEEHGAEDGLLSEVVNDMGTITKSAITARLKDVQLDPDAADEYAFLSDYLALMEQESSLNSRLRDARKALDARVQAKFGQLTESEVKALVVDDKWLSTLEADVRTELDRISQALTVRIRELADRYAEPLPQIAGDAEELQGKVAAHLERMGFVV